MSEHKKADIVGSTGEGVATTEKKARLRAFRAKPWVFGGAGVLLCAIAVVGVFYLSGSKPSNKPSSSSNTLTTNGTHESQYDQDLAMSLNGNAGPLKAYLSQQMSKASTSAQKVEVYDQEIVLDLNSQQYDDAISTGIQAYAVSPTSPTADLVGNAYLAKGDKTDAKTWFQNAINDLDKNSPTYRTDLGQYTAELQGSSS